MRKYLIFFIASFLITSGVYAFTPATLFIETFDGVDRITVNSKEQADKLFAEGYELEKISPDRLLGTIAYTTISGSDTMKNFPAVYNANNALFDAGKIDISTTTLPFITSLPGLTTANSLTSASSLSTVGALSSGSLAVGFTPVPVSLWGTGTSSPTSNMVIIGNGTSGFKVIGSGSAGQFFTSGGAGAAPSWSTSSVNEGGNYNWTGTHSFSNTNTYTGQNSFSAITTMATTTFSVIPTIPTATPTNNSDAISKSHFDLTRVRNDYYKNSQSSIAAPNGTEWTVYQFCSLTDIGANDILNIKTALDTDHDAGNSTWKMYFGNGVATSTLLSYNAGSVSNRQIYDFNIINKNSLSSQYYNGTKADSTTLTYIDIAPTTIDISSQYCFQFTYTNSAQGAGYVATQEYLDVILIRP